MNVNSIVKPASILISFLLIFLFSFPKNIFSVEIQEFHVKKQEIEAKFKNKHRDNVFYVKYKEDTSKDSIEILNNELQVRTQKKNNFTHKLLEDKNIQIIRTSGINETKEKMLEYYLDPSVEWVEVPHIGELSWVNDGETRAYSDDYFSDVHWNYEAINLPEVWRDQDCVGNGGDSPCGGSDEVIVAVLDSGLAYQDYSAYIFNDYVFLYEDSLEYAFNIEFGKASEINNGSNAINLWSNPSGETEAIHNDADNNGYCDDEHGVDFGQVLDNYYFNPLYYDEDDYLWLCENESEFQKEGHPNDNSGHGTFTTGIIASLTNNFDDSNIDTAATSISHNVTIMPLKVTQPFPYQDYIDSEAILWAVFYAIEYGADIINLSAAWPYDDELLRLAAEWAQESGVTFIAASGNDSDNSPWYPAAYPSVISVGASNNHNERAIYSSYGSKLDILAPVGDGINNSNDDWVWAQSYSCFINVECDSMSDFESHEFNKSVGTSFAAPQVAAAAALIKSRNMNISAEDMSNLIMGTAKDLGSKGYDNKTGWGLLNLEEIWNNVWTNWTSKGSTAGNITMTKFNPDTADRLYQAVRGINGKIYTRYTINGYSWSSWAAKGSTPSDITMTVFNPGTGDRLYQAVRGINGKIYTRYTVNGYSWSSWAAKGSTPGDITMVVHNPGSGDRLYQAVRGIDSKIYTRFTTNGSKWSSWAAKGSTPSDITMVVFDPGSGDRLYQAVRGVNNKIYTRYTSGGSWLTWRPNGSTPGDITMTVFNTGSSDRLYQSVRGIDNEVYTRYTIDGTNWYSWKSGNTSTKGEITMISFNSEYGGNTNHLYQAIRGTDTNVYTRSSGDGEKWTYWIRNGITSGDVSMVQFNPGSGNRLYQAVRGLDNKIYTRYLED